MELVDLGAILVASIAAIGAWAAQQTASKTSKYTTQYSAKADAEREAYERARSFDIQTIERQSAEINELRDLNERLRRELLQVKERLAAIELAFPEWEGFIDDPTGKGSDH